VAAHECGHAVQHASGYQWLTMRSKLVPFVNVALVTCNGFDRWNFIDKVFRSCFIELYFFAATTIFHYNFAS
jgi:Zn-dependent membrane protease YugP